MKNRNKFIINMVNKIRQDSPEAYKMAVPYIREGDGIQVLSNPLFTNTLAYNTFYEGITNMIWKTIQTNSGDFRNPLEVLKKGNMELGYDIREIGTDLLEAHNYQLTDELLADVLKLDPPTMYQCIHRVNRKQYYKLSLSYAELETACESWDTLAEMVITKAELLYNSNYVDEFEWCKDLLRQAVQNNMVQREEITHVTSEATGKAMVKAIKNTVSAFKYPSIYHTGLYHYTAGAKSIKVWTKPERTVLVVPSETMNELDTDVLSVAFNVDKLAFKTERTLEVDSLGYFFDYRKTKDVALVEGKTYYTYADGVYTEVANPDVADIGTYYERYYGKIEGFVFDERFTQIYDKRQYFGQNNIVSGMVEQRYLHIWELFSISLFCNSKVFYSEVDEDDIPDDYEFFKYFDESENTSEGMTLSDL